MTRWAMEARGRSLESARIAIQGTGNVGRHAAALLEEMGAQVVAMGNSKSTFYCAKGLDAGAIRRHLDGGVPMAEAVGDGVECIERDAVLGLEVDVLIPAALSGVIDSDNAADVRAGLIVEAANAPVTAAAAETLEERGIEIVPDILANSGGLTASYFEWLQSRGRRTFSAGEVKRELGKQLEHAWRDVAARREKDRCTLRQAAYRLAVERVSEARTRGQP